LKQAAVAQRQRRSQFNCTHFICSYSIWSKQRYRSDAANSIARTSFAANPFEATEGSEAANSIPPNSFIAANRFEAGSGSAVAAKQPIQLQTIHLLQLIYLKQAAVAQRQRRSQFNTTQFICCR
jgi:hypothetical protein